MKKKILIPLYMLLLLITFAYSAEQKEYVSPDGKYRAYVVPFIKASHSSGESEIIIKTKDGQTLRSKSYASKDGEHGYGVEKAAWTPNSTFFVYSMSSSGGHQPWHAPIYYISVHDLKIRTLDDYIGAVTQPDFELSAPDRIKAVGARLPLGKGFDEDFPFEVSLSELVAREMRK